MSTRPPRRAPAERRTTRRKPRAPFTLYGVHAVLAALANPARENIRLQISKNASDRLGPLAIAKSIPVDIVTPQQISGQLPEGAVHQGMLLETAALHEPGIDDIPLDGLMIVLDQISDPHNVGAILRSAAAFGAHAVISTDRHSPPQTAVLAKAASGALEQVSLVRVSNLARALDLLARAGVTTIGLDSNATEKLADNAATRPLALVLGGEGRGLRRLTRERCQLLACIDTPGTLASLNVSNATAIALYAATRP